MIDEEKPLDFDDDSEPHDFEDEEYLDDKKKMNCTIPLPKMVQVSIPQMMENVTNDLKTVILLK